jgi:arylformamidase
MGPILDISPRLSSRIAVWPGDESFSRTSQIHPSPGGPVEAGAIRTTLHVGAHADAPSHYLSGAPSMAQVELSPYLGLCEVVAVALPPGARILPEHVPTLPTAPRVLFKTGSHPDKETFRTDFNSLSPELIHALKAGGCLLVGIDTPSVDPYASERLESHRALGACDLRVLEGLELGAVEPGSYFLSALPLAVEDGDGSPVRAVLVPLAAWQPPDPQEGSSRS